jgi:hypothetical protein
MDFNLKDLMPMLFERGNAMQSYWGYYITVVGALLAFFGSVRRPKALAILFTVVFIAFAYVNADGMVQVAQEREAIYGIVTTSQKVALDSPAPASSGDLRKYRENLVAVSAPPDPAGVLVFHLIADFLVLAALWLLTLRYAPEK